jgi:hypothetical protein
MPPAGLSASSRSRIPEQCADAAARIRKTGATQPGNVEERRNKGRQNRCLCPEPRTTTGVVGLEHAHQHRFAARE